MSIHEKLLKYNPHTLAAEHRLLGAMWFVSDISDSACGSLAHLNLHCSSNTDTYRLCQKRFIVMYSEINSDSPLMWNGFGVTELHVQSWDLA